MINGNPCPTCGAKTVVLRGRIVPAVRKVKRTSMCLKCGTRVPPPDAIDRAFRQALIAEIPPCDP